MIVVDDGSRDETLRDRRTLTGPVAAGPLPRSEGPGGARNRGVRAARAPVLAFTDADCFPTPQWLARGLEAIADAELVQGRVAPDPAVPRTPFDRTLWVERDGGFYQTANLFVRRETFDAVGGFRDWALERPGRRRWSADRRRGRAMQDADRRGHAVRLERPAGSAPAAPSPGGAGPPRGRRRAASRDAIADRWHWTRDMPGLARLVPELREATFYRRWFFGEWTAQFDLAVAAASGSRDHEAKAMAARVVPYLDRVRRESCDLSRRARLAGFWPRRAACTPPARPRSMPSRSRGCSPAASSGARSCSEGRR